jgi:hypothetical protein
MVLGLVVTVDRISETHSAILLIEDGVVVVEEVEAEDPHIHSVHVGDVDTAKTEVVFHVAFLRNGVLHSIEGDCHVWELIHVQAKQRARAEYHAFDARLPAIVGFLQRIEHAVVFFLGHKDERAATVDDALHIAGEANIRLTHAERLQVYGPKVFLHERVPHDLACGESVHVEIADSQR